MPPAPPLLSVRGLRTSFRTDDGTVTVVDGVSFDLARGETLCVVGESGCGKSVTALSIMGLVATPPGRVEGEGIWFEGQDLLRLPQHELADLRGDAMAMIFQEPMTSLNPVFTIGDQIAEGVRRHRGGSEAEANARALEMLRRVRIPAPEQRLGEYPHQLSGGMRQRVMIAMALANDPRLLIADEPTTALDVTIQAQILALIRTLQAESGTAVLLITHDLGVVAEVADTVIVMYAGRVVEKAPVADLFADPQHPYTLGLLASVPRLDRREERLAAIPGAVPTPAAMPAGCRFAPRCPFAEEACRRDSPALAEVAPGHLVACRRAPLEAHVGMPPA
ncbi:MAG: ABC transporter ATP-binding protein [Thalassobaculales bacterium]